MVPALKGPGALRGAEVSLRLARVKWDADATGEGDHKRE